MDIKSQLNQIKTQSKRINDTIDEISANMRTIEESLTNIGIGDMNVHAGSGETQITFKRFHTKMRLVVTRNGDERPWSEWDTNTKIMSANQIYELFDMLVVSTEARLNHVEKTVLPVIKTVVEALKSRK